MLACHFSYSFFIFMSFSRYTTLIRTTKILLLLSFLSGVLFCNSLVAFINFISTNKMGFKLPGDLDLIGMGKCS